MDYAGRRRGLRKKVPDGDILILSASSVPRNYAANTYPFHQDATFRYYTGLEIPDAALWIAQDGSEKLYVTPPDPDDVIWTGPVPSSEELAGRAGIESAANFADLDKVVSQHTHFLEPYDFRLKLVMARLTGLDVQELGERSSRVLRLAIIDQRMHKDDEEIAEMEEAIGLTRRMLLSARAAIEPGRLESDVMSALLAPALAKERQQAFEPIVSTHGETLHNPFYHHRIESDDMVLIDCGAESPCGYCADITRTYPAVDRFSPQKQAIYDAVLAAQLAGIAQTAIPGSTQLKVHLAACRALTLALAEMGLMRGNVDESVAAGAHALFMPHGIGHALGLDAHDMENFGDDVGYANGEKRSTQFGLNALRLARRLEPGYVLTVEPGCYFIPELIDRWKASRHLEAFINYNEVEKFRDCRGVRIEDDVLITSAGSRVLGPGIEK